MNYNNTDQYYNYYLQMARNYAMMYQYCMNMAGSYYYSTNSLYTDPYPDRGYGHCQNNNCKCKEYENENLEEYCGMKISEKTLKRPGVEVNYPEVSGLADPLVQQNVNNLILDKVEDLIKKQYSQMADDPEMTGNYEIKLFKEDVLSIYFYNFAYVKGAAHGITLGASLTVDLKTAQEYQLKDLFIDGSNYKEQINSIIKQQIKQKDVPLISEFNSISQNQDYYLTEKDLVIYFQLYEYTPYVFGIPEFFISYKDLKNLDPRGIIRRLEK